MAPGLRAIFSSPLRGAREKFYALGKVFREKDGVNTRPSIPYKASSRLKKCSSIKKYLPTQKD